MMANGLNGLSSKARKLAWCLGLSVLLGAAGWSGAAGAVQMATDGAFAVNPDGTSSYSIPIEAPPGTAGMVPAISLNYSSGNGDGILGIGWSLGGLPAITRCAQTNAQDGAGIATNATNEGAGAITFTGLDRFCYGGQRLVMVTPSAYYGADQAVYRTEIDNATQIVSTGGTQATGPLYFRVYTKSGQIQEYGNATVSSNAYVQALGLSYFTARAWALDRVSDLAGNYYTVTYSSMDQTTGETHPTEIDYTGNINAQQPAHNSIKFVYDQSRAHPLIAHAAGTTATTRAMLTNVKSYAGTNLVHDYDINYLPDAAGRPQIFTVTHCDGSAPQVCLLATRFGWSSTNGTSNSATPPTAASGGNCTAGTMNSWVPYVVDLNNDGRDDIFWVQESLTSGVNLPTGTYQIWYSTDTGQKDSSGNDIFGFKCVTPSFPNSVAGLPFFGDFGGTGRTDILLQADTISNPGHWAMEVNVDDAGTFTVPAGSFPPAEWPLLSPNQILVGDFEGKGRTSLVAECQCGPTSHWFSFTNGGNYVFSISGAVGDRDANYAAYAADFNGDGRTDVLFDPLDANGKSNGGMRYIAFSLGVDSNGNVAFTPARPVTLASGAIPNTNGPARITIADLNGDGVSDIIFDPIDANGNSTGNRQILLGRGDGILPSDEAAHFDSISAGGLTNNGFVGYSIIAGNFTGSGFTDLILDQESNTGISTGIYTLFAGNGDGTFSQSDNTPTSAASYATGAQPHIADFKGVGHHGLLWVGAAGSVGDNFGNLPSNGTNKILYTDAAQADLVTGVYNGLGPQVTVTYTPLSQGGFYTKDAIGEQHPPTYPTLPLQTTAPTVSDVQRSDGVGGIRDTTYAYSQLRADTQGRGSLGFSSVTTTDTSTQISTTTTYNQSFPTIGQPTEIKTIVSGNSNPLSDTTVTYDIVTEAADSPSVTFVGPGFIKVTRTDLDNISPLPVFTHSITYDCDAGLPCFGLVATQTDTPDVNYQTKKTYTYVPADPDHWLVAQVGNLKIDDTVPGLTQSRTVDLTYNPTELPNSGVVSGLTIEKGVSSTNVANQASELALPATYHYDGYGNQISVELDPSDEPLFRKTVTSWVTPGTNLNVGAQPNALQYNQFPQSVTDPLGFTTYYGYDIRFGSLAKTVDPNSHSSSTSYDSFGRPIQALGTDGTGSKFAYAYCVQPSVTCAYTVTATPIDSSGTTIGPVVTTTYDQFGRLVQTDTVAFDGSGTRRVQTQFDALGRVLQTSQPYLVGDAINWMGYTYDVLGRVLTALLPDGGSVTHVYQGLKQTDKLPTVSGPYSNSNQLTENFVTTRNGLGEPVTQQDPLGNPTTLTYAPFGKVASVKDAGGNLVSYGYDALGRRNLVQDPDSGTRSFAYYSTGELATSNAPAATGSGVVSTSYIYDQDGRIRSRTEPDLTSIWTYDQAGALGLPYQALTGVSDPAGYPGGFTRTYGYDGSGRLSKTMLQFGSTPTFTFNTAYVAPGQTAAGLPTSVQDQVSGAQASYSYTSKGYYQGLNLGSSTGPSIYTIQTADAALRPKTVALGSAPFSNSVASGTSSAVNDAYSYDMANRLREADNAAVGKLFNYDATGNITTKSDVTGSGGSYVYGPGPHQLKSVSGLVNAGYLYDSHGNLATETPSGGQANTFGWTSFDQPKNVTESGSTVQYYYDTEHNRIAVSTSSGGNPSVMKLYLRAPGASAEAVLTSGGAVSQMADYFSSGGRMVGILATPFSANTSGVMVPGTASMLYVHTDLRGSVTGLSDVTGAVVETDSYDPWGQRRNPNGQDGSPSSSGTPYGYIGQEQVTAGSSFLNLLNLNARLYNPQLGRFISADPIGLAGGANVYAYSGNNPTSASDPSGLIINEPVTSYGSIPIFVFFDPGIGGGYSGQEGGGRAQGLIYAHKDRYSPIGSHIVSTRWTATTGTPLTLAGPPIPANFLQTSTSAGVDSTGTEGGAPGGGTGGGGLAGGAVSTGHAPSSNSGDTSEVSLGCNGCARNIPGQSYSDPDDTGGTVYAQRPFYSDADIANQNAVGLEFVNLFVRPGVELAAGGGVVKGAAYLWRLRRAALAARGLGDVPGFFVSTENAAGGTVYTSEGLINQRQVGTIVNSALYEGGPINIITGVHGLADGTTVSELSFFENDLARFGDLPGVRVFNFSELSAEERTGILNSEGTIIGAFCNSGACLAPFQ